MTYVVIDNFKEGMDRRQERIAGLPGALWDGINGHITRGGAFERRKKFVGKYNLPAGNTFGLAQINQQLFTFGSLANPGTVPAGITYQQLAAPSGAAMVKVLDVTTFNQNTYVVAQYADGSICHFYNGARVTDWDAAAEANASNNAVAVALAQNIGLNNLLITSALNSVITIQAAVAGTPFTISGSATGGTMAIATPQANVNAVPETPASGTITILGGDRGTFVQINMNGPAGSSGFPVNMQATTEITAATVAAAINTAFNSEGGPNFSAVAAGNVITVTAPPGQGATGNTYTMAFDLWPAEFSTTATQGMSIQINNTTPFVGPATGFNPLETGNLHVISGGVNAVTPVSQVSTATVGGTYAGANTYNVTINGVSYNMTGIAAGMGITALTYNEKVYSVAQSLLNFSAVDGPTIWGGVGTGDGFINILNNDASSDPLTGMAQYQGRIALFTRTNCYIWILTVDPSQNTYVQSVQNTGALSGRSIQQYGNIDVFYLDTSGVRSVRARDASNAPAVNDVGVAIDTFIQAWMAGLTGEQISRACSVIEPIDGRYWLALHNRIFVYSFFPGSKITAWSYYDLTDEIGANDITELVRAGNRVYMRSGDTVYLYGGDTGQVYPNAGEIVCTMSLPYLFANKIATVKGIKSFDAGLIGQWAVNLLPKAEDDTVMVSIGTFFQNTYSALAENPIQHPTPVFALQMVCNAAGYANISNLAVHFDIEDED